LRGWGWGDIKFRGAKQFSQEKLYTSLERENKNGLKPRL